MHHDEMTQSPRHTTLKAQRLTAGIVLSRDGRREERWEQHPLDHVSVIIWQVSKQNPKIYTLEAQRARPLRLLSNRCSTARSQRLFSNFKNVETKKDTPREVP